MITTLTEWMAEVFPPLLEYGATTFFAEGKAYIYDVLGSQWLWMSQACIGAGCLS